MQRCLYVRELARDASVLDFDCRLLFFIIALASDPCNTSTHWNSYFVKRNCTTDMLPPISLPICLLRGDLVSTPPFGYQELLQLIELIKSSLHFTEFKLRSGDLEIELRRDPAGRAPVAAAAVPSRCAAAFVSATPHPSHWQTARHGRPAKTSTHAPEPWDSRPVSIARRWPTSTVISRRLPSAKKSRAAWSQAMTRRFMSIRCGAA